MENSFELEIDKYEISVDIIMGQENTIAIYFRVIRLETVNWLFALNAKRYYCKHTNIMIGIVD